MRMIPTRRSVVGAIVISSLLVACGTDSEANEPARSDPGDVPQIVVTTDILGDIVGEVLGGLADVEVIMPSGVSPHEFQASARQADTMENADLLITNGAGFEGGMSSVIDSVGDGGTTVFSFADAADLRTLDAQSEHDDAEHEEHADDDHADDDHADDDHDDDDHAGEEHAGEDSGEHADDDHEGDDHEGDDHDDGHGHEAGSDDPHLWTDPQQISMALEALRPVLGRLDGIERTALDEQIDRYLDELDALVTDMTETLSVVPSNRRILVTNHEVFGYFAERFDFRVAGTIIPALTTEAEASTAGLDDLIELIEAERVPAIFVESTQSTQLADAIADTSDVDVAVVRLFGESLGGPDSGAATYLTMMRTNAALIADALTS